MNREKLKPWIRLLVAFSGIALIVSIFVPLWQIELVAPQYPEGLILLIYPNKLAGNVDIINGLNHYIGMKTLHTEDFIEFKILPYLIGFFAAFFLFTGISGSRKMLRVLLVSFFLFGILAMYDFWQWEYDYGHHLNPDAAIIVPGMAYQPPLIGFKQLLNFGAYSLPDLGGWITIGAGMILFIGFISTLKKSVKKIPHPLVFLWMLIAFMFSSCTPVSDPIKTGKDPCYFCKMVISNPRFGAELVTKKGKVYKFDDVQCLVHYVEKNKGTMEEFHGVYISNYIEDHTLIEMKNSLLLHSESFRSPMGGNIAGFSNADSLIAYKERFGGESIQWENIIQYD